MTFSEWKKGAIGRGMDPDGVYGYQCVDVAKDYAMALFPGVSWVDSIGYGDAKDLFAGAASKYFEKIVSNAADVNQVPLEGDIIVYRATATNPYGHIAVVEWANAQGVQVIQQDGFTPTVPAHEKWRAWNGTTIGWLRPKLAALVNPMQRVVAAGGVNYRESADTSGAISEYFATGEILDFKGFIHGETVDGNDIWFVGAHTGGYAWSGGFTDPSNSALPDLTPAPPKQQPYQRAVGSEGVNYRKYPTTSADVLKTFAAGEVLDFDAFVRGEMVQGNNIWFRGKYTGAYAWSGAFENPGTNDLPEVDPPVMPDVPGQQPVDPDYSKRPITAEPTLWGIDVSSYQGDINWPKLKTIIDYAIIKAGHVGVSYGGGDMSLDPKFIANKAAARQAGIPLQGYYWYGYLDEDPLTEAKKFVTNVGDIWVGESLYLDLEENQPSSVDKVEWAGKFLDEVERLTNRLCHLYTYYEYAVNNPSLKKLLVHGRVLWLADFSHDIGDAELDEQALGAPAIHQYSSSGLLEGVSGRVDMNVYYGTLESFKKLGARLKTDDQPSTPAKPTIPTTPAVDEITSQVRAFFQALISALRKLLNHK